MFVCVSNRVLFVPIFCVCVRDSVLSCHTRLACVPPCFFFSCAVHVLCACHMFHNFRVWSCVHELCIHYYLQKKKIVIIHLYARRIFVPPPPRGCNTPIKWCVRACPDFGVPPACPPADPPSRLIFPALRQCAALFNVKNTGGGGQRQR